MIFLIEMQKRKEELQNTVAATIPQAVNNYNIIVTLRANQPGQVREKHELKSGRDTERERARKRGREQE
jgi:hypothetical protein